MTSATLIEKCCLIAHPVAGNPTQYLVEQAFSRSDLDWRFMTFEVEPAKLNDAMRGIRALGFHGVKIAEPFQEAVIEYLDALTDRARLCGSVNCVTADGDRLLGDNTEGTALVNLVRETAELTGRKAMVVGTGRVARAIAVALAEVGAEIIAVSRSPEAGQRFVEMLQKRPPATATCKALDGVSIAIDPDVAVLVNATSLGTTNPAAKLMLETTSFGPKLIVADVAYNTSRTWLTRQAAERGCRVIDGVQLFVEQTALALQKWTGVKPDTVSMREAAEEFLGI